MNLVSKPLLQLIISEGKLLSSVESELTGYYEIFSSIDLEGHLATTNCENSVLVLCEQTVLGSKQEVAIAALKANSPMAKVLIMGSHCAGSEQVALLKHGARGYFDTSDSLAKLNESIQCVINGEVWVERHVISGLIDELTHVPEISEEQKEAVATLSPKELEVAQLVSHGATNKMIANNMAITERTVKAHLTTIFQKMALTDRLSLAILFRDLRD